MRNKVTSFWRLALLWCHTSSMQTYLLLWTELRETKLVSFVTAQFPRCTTFFYTWLAFVFFLLVLVSHIGSRPPFRTHRYVSATNLKIEKNIGSSYSHPLLVASLSFQCTKVIVFLVYSSSTFTIIHQSWMTSRSKISKRANTPTSFWYPYLIRLKNHKCRMKSQIVFGTPDLMYAWYFCCLCICTDEN
jgi:hypothetical protein